LGQLLPQPVVTVRPSSLGSPLRQRGRSAQRAGLPLQATTSATTEVCERNWDEKGPATPSTRNVTGATKIRDQI
jgi:hypothetical protein